MPPPALAPHADTAAPVAAPPPPSAAKAAFWDRIAPKYATDPIADMAGYRHTLQRVQAMLRPEHHVLELGCGTGITALRLAPLTRRYVATDVSSQMIAIAHASVELRRGRCRNARLWARPLRRGAGLQSAAPGQRS